MKIQYVLCLSVTVILSGCSGFPQRSTIIAGDNSPLSICNQIYITVDKSISTARTMDAEGKKLPGFHYLRSNRFLASLGEQAYESDHMDEWLDQLIFLDQQARTVELNNLPTASKHNLLNQLVDLLKNGQSLEQALKHCASQFKTYDLAKPERLKKIIETAKVEDDYSILKRMIGLYPITRHAVYLGYQRWKNENLGSFNISHDHKKWTGKAVSYQPETNTILDSKKISTIIKKSRRTQLNIPELSIEDLTHLAEYFAPVFLIDEVNKADKIGKPVWSTNIKSTVDVEQPVTFVRLGYTWFDNVILPQLIYTIWFSERPEESEWDILAGKLDGIIWRVTIDENGKALIADTIHPCGCYHLFFPANGVNKKTVNDISLEETIDIAQILPNISPHNRLSIRLATNSHYVEALSDETTLNPNWDYHSYKLIINHPVPEFELRSMPLPSGENKSLYDQEGLVAGSERIERWLLWPMGIKNPGAMRQWGKHATVFVGRRHFDEPYLFEHSFMKTGNE